MLLSVQTQCYYIFDICDYILLYNPAHCGQLHYSSVCEALMEYD